jgi:hypothetical protein
MPRRSSQNSTASRKIPSRLFEYASVQLRPPFVVR